MHKLTIKDFGPIQKSEIDINRIVILTGKQASGKSTIAKTIYFFRTIRDDIYDLMLKQTDKSWRSTLEKMLRNKFMQLFGSSYAMPRTMELVYKYADKTSIRIFLGANYNYEKPNFINFEFSADLENYLEDLDSQIFRDITKAQLQQKRKKLIELFKDPYETIYIPAGRSMITLFTSQLNYIFASLDDMQKRSIDYCTQRYVELVLRLKPTFTKSMEGMIQESKDNASGKSALALPRVFADKVNAILQAKYRYENGEERLYLDSGEYIKLNFTSSGQQETVWVLNIMFYYLLQNRQVFLILEEPEAHLYPDSQMLMTDLLGFFVSGKNALLASTHSPYILGEINNLLLANTIGKMGARQEAAVKEVIDKRAWLDCGELAAYHTHDHLVKGAMSEGLVCNEFIDGASQAINERCDNLLTIQFEDGVFL